MNLGRTSRFAADLLAIRLRIILLLTDDQKLATRVSDVLSPGEEVIRLARTRERLSLSGRTYAGLVVLDCRGLDRSETELAILRLRECNTERFRLVALGEGMLGRRLEVLGRNAVEDLDVVLTDHESVGITLRALLNDVDGTIGIATALEAIRRRFGPRAIRLAEAVLASGCRLREVSRTASSLRQTRGSLGSDLAEEIDASPKEIVRLARATYGAVLVTRTSLTLSDIAARLNFSAGRYVQDLFASEFDARAEELRTRGTPLPVEQFLDTLLVEWWARRATSEGSEEEGMSMSDDTVTG